MIILNTAFTYKVRICIIFTDSHLLTWYLGPRPFNWCHLTDGNQLNLAQLQSRISRSRNLQKGGKSLPFPSPLLFLSSFSLPPLPSPLEVGPLKPARGSREHCKIPKRIWCTVYSECNAFAFVHLNLWLIDWLIKAVRKPLVEIILNILSTTFYRGGGAGSVPL